MLLTSFFETVYKPRKLRGKSPDSIRLYRLTLNQFGLTLERPAKIADLTEDNVLAHLSRRSAVAAATRNKELSQLLSLWRLAAQRGLLKGWPDIDREHEPERAPIAWMPDELHRLLDAASTMPGSVGQVPAKTWWPGLIRLALDTGERIGAIRQAQWSWVQGEWLLVPAETRKGKTRDRRYRLSPETTDALKAIKKINPADKNVFPWPYCASYIWDKYRKVLRRAGLPTGRKYMLHCLRKTVGSAVHAAGLDAQDVLDHADKRTTRRYLDPRFTRVEQPCDILATMLANPLGAKTQSAPTLKTKTG